MSTKSKLLALTEGLQVDRPKAPAPAAAPAPASEVPSTDPRAPTDDSAPPAALPTAPTIRFPPVPTGALPRTAPGQMLQVRSQILAAEGEAGKLREQLKQHEGSAPTRKLDAAKVRPSRWANRHPDAFDTPEFARLKQDIENAGGNVQPISVRPVAGESGAYEIVFGHRRHRACLELGLPVLATIDNGAVSDADLFVAMDRENRERADLSPYEQGLMYRRALNEGLYPSNRRMAESLGVSHTWVANVLQVADLPAPLLECFRSPLEVQHRHARLLSAAYESDRKTVLRRADKFRQQGRPQAPGVVVDTLLGTLQGPGESPKGGVLAVDGRRLGAWTIDKRGRLVVTVDAGVVEADHADEMAASIARHLVDAPRTAN